MTVPEYIAIQFWWQDLNIWLPNSDDSTWMKNYPILMTISQYLSAQFSLQSFLQQSIYKHLTIKMFYNNIIEKLCNSTFLQMLSI